MGVTFYIAASSTPESVERVRNFARDLEALGWRNHFDWTQHLTAPEADHGPLVTLDLNAVRHATVFILIADPMSYGGMAELGARITNGAITSAAGQEAHVIGANTHFFFSSCWVRRYATWTDFLAYVGARAVGQKLAGQRSWLEAAGTTVMKDTVRSVDGFPPLP